MIKPLGRPSLPEDQRKEQHNLRFTKEKMHQIQALFPNPDLQFPQKIYALIDDYIQKFSELVTYTLENDNYSISPIKKGVERIAYLNGIKGEKDLYAYKNTSLKNVINDVIKNKKLSQEYIINDLIPCLNLLGYLVQIINIPNVEIFDVWVMKNPKNLEKEIEDKCCICKQKIIEDFTKIIILKK
jgi:hypothetical protein